MAMTLASATARLARTLNISEEQVARSMGAVSEVVTTLTMAQADVPNAPRAQTQQAVLRMLSAQRKMAEAQSEILRAHGQLKKIAVSMTGEEPWCPSNPLTSAELDDDNVAA